MRTRRKKGVRKMEKIDFGKVAADKAFLETVVMEYLGKAYVENIGVYFLRDTNILYGEHYYILVHLDKDCVINKNDVLYLCREIEEKGFQILDWGIFYNEGQLVFEMEVSRKSGDKDGKSD